MITRRTSASASDRRRIAGSMSVAPNLGSPIRTRIRLSAFVLGITLGNLAARTIEGQVFVATNQGAGIKLALAEVYVLSRDQVAEMEKNSREAAVRISALSRKQEEELEKDHSQKARSESLKYVYEAERKLEVAKKNGSPQQIQTAEFNLSEEKKTYEANLESARMSVSRELESGRQLIRSEADREIHLARFRPQGIPPVTRTDADGLFSVAVSPGSAILISIDRRLPSSEKEELRWFLWGESLPASGKVLFSNHNWFGSDTPGQVLQPLPYRTPRRYQAK